MTDKIYNNLVNCGFLSAFFTSNLNVEQRVKTSMHNAKRNSG